MRVKVIGNVFNVGLGCNRLNLLIIVISKSGKFRYCLFVYVINIKIRVKFRKIFVLKS